MPPTEGPPPTVGSGVWVPLPLWSAMAACYYGDAPRYGQRPEPAHTPPPMPTSPAEDPGTLLLRPAITRGGFKPMGINARPAQPAPDGRGVNNPPTAPPTP